MFQRTEWIVGNDPLEIGLGSNLRHLDCRWRVEFMEDPSMQPLVPIHNFITALSKLETLGVGFEYYTIDHWYPTSRISQVSTSPVILSYETDL